MLITAPQWRQQLLVLVSTRYQRMNTVWRIEKDLNHLFLGFLIYLFFIVL